MTYNFNDSAKSTEVIKELKNRESIEFNIGVIYLYTVEIAPLTYETTDRILHISHKHHPHSLKTEHEIYL